MVPALALLACAPPQAPHEPPPVPRAQHTGAPQDPAEAHTGWIDVALEAPVAVWAVCTAADDPTDRHLVEALEPATEHALAVRGLRASTRHSCTVRTYAGAVVGRQSFTTGPLPDLPELSISDAKPGASWGAYTLFNTQRDAFGGALHSWIAIADLDGAYRWSHDVGDNLVVDLDASLVDATAVHVGGGWGIAARNQSNRGVFRTVGLDGVVRIERTAPDFGLGFNHHSAPQPDGSYLSLTFFEHSRAGPSWLGVGVEHWHPEDGLLWTWDTQALVDAGAIGPGPPGTESPYHANSVKFHTDAHGPAAWISLYGAREIWRIDRATGARTHVLGPEGDFALVDPSGAALPPEEWFYVQHDPDYTDDGRVLVYDNGQDRPGGSFSRVAELSLDLDTRRATLLWSWTEPGWYNPIVGDADYLPNGNVLVTRGFSRAWTPNSPDTSQVLELDRQTDQVLWRMSWPTGAHIVFRAQRYDGCAVFQSAATCPAVAERIEALEGR